MKTALQELIEDIKANIHGCAVNLQESGLSDKERAIYNGAIMAGKDALRNATELLNKEKQQMIDTGNHVYKEYRLACKFIYDNISEQYSQSIGEEYYSKKYGTTPHPATSIKRT